jgi:two-component system, OmpR family, phosphate regulon sensor histidine kinase PhoR
VAKGDEVEARTGVLDTRELWRLTMEHSPVGMALVAPDGEILAANAALGEMLGYDADELVRRSVADLTHPDDLATDLGLMRRAMAGAMASYRVPKRCFRADGSLLRGELSALLLRSPEGEPLHFIMQIVDRTDVHAFAERLDAAEQAAFDTQRTSQAILETVSVGLLLVDADGTYSSWNRRQQELLDIAFPDGHGGRAGQSGFVYDAEQQHALTFEQFPCARATEGGGEEFDDLLIWIGEDPATRRALSVSARTVEDRTGTLAGAVLAYNDVTELIGARTVKDDFVATVSHELRTPLAAAMANLELLDVSGAVGPEAQPQVAAARRNVLRLSHLVADLLFTATATSGMQVIDPFRVDLAMIVAEAVSAAGAEAEAGGIDLAMDLPDELHLLADGLRLRQVADNLIDNALTFTPAGGRVTVTLSSTRRQAQLDVADSGEGIEPDDLAEVFAPFVRGQNARRRLSPGAGLGLTIVRTIVEAHGGEVSAHSNAGEGTTVRVVLPR